MKRIYISSWLSGISEHPVFLRHSKTAVLNMPRSMQIIQMETMLKAVKSKSDPCFGYEIRYKKENTYLGQKKKKK